MSKKRVGISMIDKVAISVIKRGGGIVHLDLKTGEGCLEGSTTFPPKRMRRLEQLGMLIPNEDALFGMPSQTYRLTDAAKEII